MKTQISDAIDVADEQVRLDAQIKKILANKKILSWIVKYTMKECADMNLDMIESCIEGEPKVSKVPVYPGKTNMENITGLSTEDKVPNEGEVTYDIRFYMMLPGSGRKPMKIIINLESQNDYYPGYDLVTRAVFYCARMLSAQLGTEFTTNSNDPEKYDNIKKVYSIWVCFNTPHYAANTITEYCMTQKAHYGNFTGKSRYDLLSVVMICLAGSKKHETSGEQNELIQMLNILFSAELDKEDKKKRLQEEYGIPMDDGFGTEVDDMGNVSEYFISRGMEQGMEKGRNDIIEGALRNGNTLEQVSAFLNIPLEEVRKVEEKMMQKA